MMKQLLLVLFTVTAAGRLYSQQAALLTAKSKVYIVRHAEKQNGKDPLLTEEGNKRAGDLERIL